MEAIQNPRNQWPAFGTLLVRDGAVTPEQLEAALAEQRLRPDLRLGEVLLEQGVVRPEEISRVLAEQHELEFVELDPTTVDLGAALLLPEKLALRYRALPIRFLPDGYVLIAVADPTNVMFSDELRLAVGRPVRLCVAAPDAIAETIASLTADPKPEEKKPTAPEPAEMGDDARILDLHHDAPSVLFINRAIATSLDLGASDVHFTPQLRELLVRARVDGVMREITSTAGTNAAAIVSRLKIMGSLDIAERRLPQDGRVTLRRADDLLDVRIATLPTTHGEKVTLRMLSQGEAPESLDALGLSAPNQRALQQALDKPFGAIVVVGPTGSGKTTTLFTCLRQLNTPDRQLTTIEDPVEYRVDGLDQVEVNPRACLTFASGLRTILRSDPDVLLVGEIRDEETAQIAFRASMTGHLILTTLHAQTASSAIQRLADMNIERSILATSINCIISQRLARRLCPDCSVPSKPDARLLQALGGVKVPPRARFMAPVGCDACGGIGYRGRIPVFEILTMTDDIALLIGEPTRKIEGMAVSAGMATMRDDALRLAADGITSLQEVRRVVGETVV